MKIRNMYTLKEMKEKSLEFYKGLNVETSQENILLAVRSLTMPQYAKEYKDKYGETIGDHTALATVGDAVCGAFLMLDRYTDEKTSKTLTEEKEIVKNDRLNVIGKKMLCDEDGIFLFASNNDLESNNEDHPNKRLMQQLLKRLLVLSLCWIKIKRQTTQIEFSKNTYQISDGEHNE